MLRVAAGSAHSNNWPAGRRATGTAVWAGRRRSSACFALPVRGRTLPGTGVGCGRPTRGADAPPAEAHRRSMGRRSTGITAMAVKMSVHQKVWPTALARPGVPAAACPAVWRCRTTATTAVPKQPPTCRTMRVARLAWAICSGRSPWQAAAMMGMVTARPARRAGSPATAFMPVSTVRSGRADRTDAEVAVAGFKRHGNGRRSLCRHGVTGRSPVRS
jgi:hypothetical protein